jgi:hypothetical protein
MNTDRATMCSDKKRLTREVAMRIARRAAECEQMHTYLCPACHHWHIGHIPSSEFVTRMKKREWRDAR